MLQSFNKTTCSFPNSPLPNLTHIINHRKLGHYKTLWDIYSDICFNQFIKDSQKITNDNNISKAVALQNMFLKNYSLFLQSLIISLVKLLGKKPLEARLVKIIEKLSTTHTNNFFLGNMNETNFFVSAHSHDTVLTSMCNETLSTINSAVLFENLIAKAFIKSSSETFIEFISHKNYLGMSALQIAIQSEKEEFLTILLKYIKKIILKDPNFDSYNWFFNQDLVTSSNETYSLINKAIMTNNNLIFNILMDNFEEIYGINNHYYLKFINNNLPLPPIVLTLLLVQEKNFSLLIERAIVAYKNQSLSLINYLSQKKIFKENNSLEIISLLHLIIKLNNRSRNIEIINELLRSPIDKMIVNQLDHNRADNQDYLINLSNSLINALLKVSNNDSEIIFNYFTITNSKGETLLHLIDNKDVSNNNQLVIILNKLKSLFHNDNNKFLKIINYRDFQGFTPFLITKSSNETDKVNKLLIDNYPIDQHAQLYSSLLLTNEENLFKEDVSFINMNYIQIYSTTYGNIFTIQQLRKENIFSLFTYLFQHTNAQALNARVQEIKYNKPDLLQLDQEEQNQISIYQSAIEIFYNYTLDNKLPLIGQYKGYTSDPIAILNTTLAEFFINNQYQYVLLHKTDKDILLIGKSDINYYFFSHSLFSPIKVFPFTYTDDIYQIALWIKKYFFIERSGTQGYIFYPFNFYKNSNNAEFHTLRLKENAQHYRNRLNALNLTVIITDEILLEQKVLDLPIKVIQKFFFLEHLSIRLEKFKNKINFFDFYSKQLTFRVELMEDYFFTLNASEKHAFQSILNVYPTISFEKHDNYFKALEDKKEYLELQQLFLEFYGEMILSKIRLENFDITQWQLHDLYEISLECYQKSIDALESDFIDELMKLRGKKTILQFLYQEKIQPLITHLRSRKPRAIKDWENIFFPALSSLPYAIKAIAKMATHSAESAINDFLTATAPWIDLATPALIDKLYKNLPPGLVLALDNLQKKCPQCAAGLSKIAKNFPMFSMVIITKSLVDTLNDCDLSKPYTTHYCINTLSNIFISYVIAAIDTTFPIETEEEIKYTVVVLVTLIAHGFGVETYYQYKKLADRFNLSQLGFLQKSYLALNTALGSISTDNFNYATIGIESKDLVFATLERFIDNHAKNYSLDYTYAALAIPNIEEHEQKISESGKIFPIFKIEKLSNFEFIFTKNTTFCHDPSGIKITPDHAKKFSEEYNLGIGTFVKFLGPKERKCSKGELITAPYLAKSDYAAKAVILTNTLPESDRKHLRLSSVNFLFGLIDPATFSNYTWTFREDYQKSDSKELIGFIVKRIIPLQERETPNIARIKITGQGLVRPDVVENTYSINFGIYSSSIGKNAEIVIEPSVETPIKQFFGFFSPLQTDLFYFDGDTLTNKKGLSIINLKQVKNLGYAFANQFFTTGNLVISIPCNHTLECRGGLAKASYPFQLARPACNYSLYHTAFYFQLMPNTQFTYNNTLKFTVGSFQVGDRYAQGVLIVYIHKKEEFQLSKNICFDQITIIPSIENLILKFNLDNTTAEVYLSLEESAKYLDHYSHRIEGYWSKETSNKKIYLEFLKKKGEIWKTKLAALELDIKVPSIPAIEFEVININKNNNCDEIVIRKSIAFIHFYFPKENDFVITGDFTDYSLLEYKLYLIQAESKKSTTILFPKTNINLIDINNVSYFINFKTERLLAVNIKGPLTQPLLAPLRIADSFEKYSDVTPINFFSTKFIKFLQFDNILVSVRYFNYYQFFTKKDEEFIKKDNFKISRLTQEKFEVDNKQASRIEDSDNFKRFKPIIREEAVTSSATQPKGWINSLFNYFLKEKSNSNPSVFDLDRPKDAVIKESIALDHCITGVTLGGIYREEGITCYSKNMKVMLFPKANSTKIAKPQDRYSKLPLRPIEFNGCPSVYFEGEQTHAFYVPEIPMNPLDSFNDQLILLRVLLHEVKKTYRWFKNFLTGKSDQSESLAEESGKSFITHQTKNSWKERLNNIEKQLSDVNRLARGKVDLCWIQSILEDRKEEFNYLNQLTEQNSEITKAFTENLHVLQSELAEIKENMRFLRKTDNTDNFTDKKETVLTSRSNPCFFNFNTENLSLADCNVIGLNSRRPEPKPNELNRLVQGFYRK